MIDSDLHAQDLNCLSSVIKVIKSVTTNLIKGDHTQIRRVIFSKNNQGKINA